MEGRQAARGAGGVVGARDHLEGRGRGHRRPARPRVELGPDLVGAAGGRGDERAAGALAEVQAEGGEGQLGDVVGGGGELSRERVGFDPQRLFDDDPELLALDHQVDGDQRVPGEVLVGLGDVEVALEGVGDEWAFDFHRADLGGLRAALAGPGGEGFGFQVLLRADRQPFGLGGVDAHPLGQGDDGLFDVGLGGGARFGALQAFVGDVEGEVEAGRAGRGLGGRLSGDRGFEAELLAFGEGGGFDPPGEPVGVGEVGFAVGEEGAGVLVGVDGVGGRVGGAAAGRQGEEGPAGGRGAGIRGGLEFEFFARLQSVGLGVAEAAEAVVGGV